MEGWLVTDPTLIDITAATLTVHHQGTARSWTLERNANGHLTESTRARVTSELGAWLGRPSWQSPRIAWVALGARGVSLRRIHLPPTAANDLPQVLRLQVESEFPLAPEDLAWGPQNPPLPPSRSSPSDPILVAAARLDAVADWNSLLSDAGLQPQFTIGALVRYQEVPRCSKPHAQLDLRPEASELLLADDLGPVSLRVLPGTRSGASTLAEALARALPPGSTHLPIWITTTGSPEDASNSVALASATADARMLPEIPAHTHATLHALARQVSRGTHAPLQLGVQPATTTGSRRSPVPWPWVGLAAALALACLTLPWIEAWWFRPALARQLEDLRKAENQLTLIDRQVGFLRHLRQEQPPYLDTLFLLARTLPPGVQLQSLGMNRAGEVQLRATLANAQQVLDFRSQLADSGFFSDVTIEEQTPAPNRQQMIVRVTAHWKSAADRAAAPLLNTDSLPDTPSSSSPNPGMPMPMPMPMPMTMPGPRPRPMPMPASGPMSGPVPSSVPGSIPGPTIVVTP